MFVLYYYAKSDYTNKNKISQIISTHYVILIKIIDRLTSKFFSIQDHRSRFSPGFSVEPRLAMLSVPPLGTLLREKLKPSSYLIR